MRYHKVLFLNLDGVLVTRRSMAIAMQQPDDGGKGLFRNSLDAECVARMNRVVAETGCDVVLSSSIRLINSLGDCQRFLRSQGCAFRLSGMTPGRFEVEGFGYSRRGHEIAKWLVEHPENKTFVIVDDDSDMVDLMDHLVQTSNPVGIQDAEADELIRRLNAGSAA